MHVFWFLVCLLAAVVVVGYGIIFGGSLAQVEILLALILLSLTDPGAVQARSSQPTKPVKPADGASPCPDCRAMIADTAAYCSACGAPRDGD